MTQFGSLVNTLMSGTRGQPEPEVGMGVTFLRWSDRSPGTIVSVTRFKSGARKGQVRKIGVQADKAIRTDDRGMSDAQTYRFERQPDTTVIEATVRKDGSFVTTGGARLRIGQRDSYYDYSF